MRPNDAPTAIEGTNMPAGTLHPYDMMTSKVRRIVANAKEKTMDHRFSDLVIRSLSVQSMCILLDVFDLLAKTIVIISILTFPEQNLHHFSHVDLEEHVRIA